MSTQTALKRPEPVKARERIELFNRAIDTKQAIRSLEAGKPVLITEFYSNGLTLLRALHIHLKRKYPDNSFKAQRKYRAAYHKLSNLILIEIVDHSLAVKKSPLIGWFEELYPEHHDFLLSFPQVQGLNSSWQWYKKGISVPVLRNKIHPYYGTYFPTRFDHLILFDNWLKRYDGPKKSAIDVGIGCGVLSFQLVKHGFQKVFGTDINPNAITGLREYMGDTKLSRKIELDLGQLFGRWEKQTELIVFNPPWLPVADKDDNGDEAIYYDEVLFPKFFEEAKRRLLTEGKMVILFSNIAQITSVTKDHPIERELAEGGRFKLDNLIKKKVKSASDKTKRDQNWRSDEEVELWELVHE